MTNADESLNESPYAFLTEHFSLYSFYSLPGVRKTSMRGKTLPYMSFKSSKTTAPKTELSVDLTGVWAKEAS